MGCFLVGALQWSSSNCFDQAYLSMRDFTYDESFFLLCHSAFTFFCPSTKETLVSSQEVLQAYALLKISYWIFGFVNIGLFQLKGLLSFQSKIRVYHPAEIKMAWWSQQAVGWSRVYLLRMWIGTTGIILILAMRVAVVGFDETLALMFDFPVWVRENWNFKKMLYCGKLPKTNVWFSVTFHASFVWFKI